MNRLDYRDLFLLLEAEYDRTLSAAELRLAFEAERGDEEAMRRFLREVIIPREASGARATEHLTYLRRLLAWSLRRGLTEQQLKEIEHLPEHPLCDWPAGGAMQYFRWAWEELCPDEDPEAVDLSDCYECEPGTSGEEGAKTL